MGRSDSKNEESEWKNLEKWKGLTRKMRRTEYEKWEELARKNGKV